MEGFKMQHRGEQHPGSSVNLDSDKISRQLFGRPLESGLSDLTRAFAIMRHIKEKALNTRDTIETCTRDLYREFQIGFFAYNTLFTPKVIDQLMEPGELDTMSFDFNHVPVNIRKDSTVESVMAEWKAAGSTEEGMDLVSERAVHEMELLQTQEKIDLAFAEVENLDFNNTATVIDWLYYYNELYRNGVDLHKKVLIEKFTAKGYSIERNDKVEFMLSEVLRDKERLGKSIIASMLVNTGLFLRNEQMKTIIENWKNM